MLATTSGQRDPEKETTLRQCPAKSRWHFGVTKRWSLTRQYGKVIGCQEEVRPEALVSNSIRWVLVNYNGNGGFCADFVWIL
jgi:hypothetical protein